MMNRTEWTVTAACLILATLAVTTRSRRVLCPEGYGLVRFGSQLLDIEKKLGERAEPAESERDADCGFATFPAYPGMRFMVEQGVVTRGDALDATIPNSLGIALGTSYGVVTQRFPLVVIEEHVYYADGHYLIFRSPDGRRAVVLEEEGGRIIEVRAGLEPSVEYVEGCL